MHLHVPRNNMLYMKLQKDNSTSQSFVCCHFLLQTRCLCFSPHSDLQQVSNGSMLARRLSCTFHTNNRKREQGLCARLHPWRFPGSGDGNIAPFPREMSFSHLWSPEPTGPTWPAAIRCLLCTTAGSRFSPGHYFSPHAPADPLEAAGCSCPLPSCVTTCLSVPVTTNPTPALQAEETRAQLPQTSTNTLGLFSLGSTAQSCRPVRGCDLQKQKTDRQTHTLRKLLRGLATLRPPLLRKSKVRNSEEKGEMILQNHDQLFPVVWDL